MVTPEGAMKNSEAFLTAFNQIEKHLRRKIGARQWIPFTQLIAQSSRSSPEVRRFREDLKEFADLRNAIVHDRMNGEVIAEPNEWAVERIGKIAAVVTSPPAVIPLFAKRVFSIGENRPLGEAVKLMNDHDFTKLPVIGRGHAFVGLLTANTITRWLGATVGGGVIDLRTTTVQQALEFTERGESEMFVGPGASVFQVYELFHRVESRGKTLEAVIITEDGVRSDRFLGLITVADLPRILPYVELAMDGRRGEGTDAAPVEEP